MVISEILRGETTMSKYKIYWTYNGKKEKIDETNSLKDAYYLTNEYRLAYRGQNGIISNNIKDE